MDANSSEIISFEYYGVYFKSLILFIENIMDEITISKASTPNAGVEFCVSYPIYFYFFKLISSLFYGYDQRIILTCPVVNKDFQSIFLLQNLVIFPNPNLYFQMVKVCLWFNWL